MGKKQVADLTFSVKQQIIPIGVTAPFWDGCPLTNEVAIMSEQEFDRYRCHCCNLEQVDDADFEEICPQCETVDQFYLIESSGS